ncbi:MAG: polysaccharide deacetylase family protein [Cupriavidus necator]
MPLDHQALQYPHRRAGMDHDRYDWSMLAGRAPVRWPGGKTLALWVNVSLQFFPLNPTGKPVAVPGNMTMPYPDLRHYTLRDYGNRVGIHRMLRAFDRYGVRPTFAINSRLAELYPSLLATVTERGDEIIGHSWSMDTAHAGGLDESVEAEVVRRSLDQLRTLSGRDIRGWLSPGKLQSANTPELLRANGIGYMCDWVNDDMPYPFRTRHGELWAMPLSTELEDRFVLMENRHPEASWARQVMDACDLLLDEAREQGGRILALSVHPWVLGQPHRIRYLEAALEYVMARPEVWSAGAGEILAAFAAQDSQQQENP